MKNVVLFLTALILGTSGVMAMAMATATTNSGDKVSDIESFRYNDSFIFVENGITFSVYPDGEFDFYIENQVTGRRNGVTFNSGFDYSPYAQYDDYGAVIQVEDVPVYYDNYGRVTQIGDVDINYNRNRVNRVGNMYVYYNSRGFYDHHTGYINVYNRHYVYQPFHAFFARPSVGLCLVYNRPYRRYYSPIRYTYYNPYRHNTRRAYAKIGRTHRYNNVRSERSQIYRNDQRVAVRDKAVRSNRSVAKRSITTTRSNRSVAKPIRTERSQTVKRSANLAPSRSGNSVGLRSSSSRSVSQAPSRSKISTATRSSSSRSVSQAPSKSRSNAATRSSSSRSVSQAPSRRTSSAATRSSSSRSVNKAPSRSQNSVSSRSASSRSTASRATSGSNRNTQARTSSSRSSRRY